jgi:iron complex transport system substrate-binding protein
MPPCGWELDRIQRELTCVTSRPEWSPLSAVGSGRVALADGKPFFNRPGRQLVESAEILAEVFRSDEPSLAFKQEGAYWCRLGG